jgi:hypothetical protein
MFQVAAMAVQNTAALAFYADSADASPKRPKQQTLAGKPKGRVHSRLWYNVIHHITLLPSIEPVHVFDKGNDPCSTANAAP